MATRKIRYFAPFVHATHVTLIRGASQRRTAWLEPINCERYDPTGVHTGKTLMLPKVSDYLGRRGTFASRLILLSLALLVLFGLWQEWPARPLATLPLESACLDLRVSQDGSTLLAVQKDHLTLWDLATYAKRGGCDFPTRLLTGYRSGLDLQLQVERLWLAADGRKVALNWPRDEAGRLPDYHVRLLDVEQRPDSPFILPGCHGGLSRTPPDSPLLVTQGERGYRLWDVATGQELYPGKLAPDGILDVCPLPDGRVLAVREECKTGWLWDEAGLHVWDLSGRSPAQWLPGLTGFARIVPGGRRLTAFRGMDAVLVDLPTGQIIKELRLGLFNNLRYEGPNLLALFSRQPPDTRSDEQRWRLYIWQTGDELPRVHGPLEWAGAPWPQLSPDGRWGAFWSRADPQSTAYCCALVELDSGTTAGQTDGGLVGPACFSTDSRFLAARVERPRPVPLLQRWFGRGPLWTPETMPGVKVWSVPGGEAVATFDERKHLAFVPGRPVLAVAGTEGDIELWELPPRRAVWIDLLLASLFGPVLWLLLRSLQRLRSPI